MTSENVKIKKLVTEDPYFQKSDISFKICLHAA